MGSIIAIDPGDVFVGVAFFETRTPDNPFDETQDEEWECVDAQEFSPDDFIFSFAEAVLDGETYDAVVCESWRLYADHATEQTGSEFLTSQLIGKIKFVVQVRNRHSSRHAAAEAIGKMMTCELGDQPCADPEHKAKDPVLLVMQVADIKKPTRGILQHKKIKSIAKPIARALYSGRDHIIDAELHGWHYILNARHKP